MLTTADTSLLDVLLDSWDRGNTILVNLLRALPPNALAVQAAQGSPSIAQMFHHIHFVRLIFLEEDAPEFARALPEAEWCGSFDAAQLTALLEESATAVREAVRASIQSGRSMDLHYDHPLLLLQHMIWHEGYHHGQIKLALKLAGMPVGNEIAGPLTWRVWMSKTTH